MTYRSQSILRFCLYFFKLSCLGLVLFVAGISTQAISSVPDTGVPGAIDTGVAPKTVPSGGTTITLIDPISGLPEGWKKDLCQKFSNPQDCSKITADQDSDQDGLTNLQEFNYGINPLDPDSDDDGLMDSFEIYISKTNPLHSDSDSTQTNQVGEAGNQIKDGDEDFDGDGLPNSLETSFIPFSVSLSTSSAVRPQLTIPPSTLSVSVTYGRSPAPSSTDVCRLYLFGGLSSTQTDQFEAFDIFGLDNQPLRITCSEAKPQAPRMSIFSADSDGDGLRDGEEFLIGSSPVLSDSDGDGLTDRENFSQMSGENPLFEANSKTSALSAISSIPISGKVWTLAKYAVFSAIENPSLDSSQLVKLQALKSNFHKITIEGTKTQLSWTRTSPNTRCTHAMCTLSLRVDGSNMQFTDSPDSKGRLYVTFGPNGHIEEGVSAIAVDAPLVQQNKLAFTFTAGDVVSYELKAPRDVATGQSSGKRSCTCGAGYSCSSSIAIDEPGVQTAVVNTPNTDKRVSIDPPDQDCDSNDCDDACSIAIREQGVKAPRDVATGQSSGKRTCSNDCDDLDNIRDCDDACSIAIDEQGIHFTLQSSAIKAPRDVATGQSSGKRQHKPYLTMAFGINEQGVGVCAVEAPRDVATGQSSGKRTCTCVDGYSCSSSYAIKEQGVKAPRDVATGQSSGKRTCTCPDGYSCSSSIAIKEQGVKAPLSSTNGNPDEDCDGISNQKRQHGSITIYKSYDKHSVPIVAYIVGGDRSRYIDLSVVETDPDNNVVNTQVYRFQNPRLQTYFITDLNGVSQEEMSLSYDSIEII